MNNKKELEIKYKVYAYENHFIKIIQKTLGNIKLDEQSKNCNDCRQKNYCGPIKFQNRKEIPTNELKYHTGKIKFCRLKNRQAKNLIIFLLNFF